MRPSFSIVFVGRAEKKHETSGQYWSWTGRSQFLPQGQTFPSLRLSAQDEKSGTQLSCHFPPPKKKRLCSKKEL